MIENLLIGLGIYLLIGLLIAVIGILRDKHGYWNARGKRLLYLVVQEMILWGPMLVIFIVIELLALRRK